jgi:hypothetical protein
MAKPRFKFKVKPTHFLGYHFLPLAIPAVVTSIQMCLLGYQPQLRFSQRRTSPLVPRFRCLCPTPPLQFGPEVVSSRYPHTSFLFPTCSQSFTDTVIATGEHILYFFGVMGFELMVHAF